MNIGTDEPLVKKRGRPAHPQPQKSMPQMPLYKSSGIKRLYKNGYKIVIKGRLTARYCLI
jgi:hypothetical protein